MCAAKLQYQDHLSKEMQKLFVTLVEEQISALPYQKESGESEQHEVISSLSKFASQVSVSETRAPAPQERLVVMIVTVWITLFSIASFLDLSQDSLRLFVGIAVLPNLLFF